MGVAYWLAAFFSLKVSLVGGIVSPVWPPTGIALVGFLLLGRAVWPAVTVAAFLVNMPRVPFGAAVAIAAGNTFAPL
ncbi:MAG: MASE1 domain-containing protein, partial [Actinomycetota bacterium]